MQILADFQSCTGIEDVGECIMYLEATNWNLLDAINSFMPEESQTLPSEREAELPMEIVEGASGIAPPPPPPPLLIEEEIQSTSRNTKSPHSVPIPVDEVQLAARLLNFSVQYKENMVPLEVPDSETVAAIKTALHSELGVPPCRQELCGWKQNHINGYETHITDDTVLSSLQLPQRTHLFLVAPDHVNLTPVEGINFSNRMNKNYKLHIIDTTNNKDYTLQFPGSKTVLDVKLGLRDVTNIPVRFQHWVGWPDSLKDENTKLAALDLPDTVLELILSREEGAPKSKKQLVVDLASSESDNDFEDAADCFGVDDDMFQASSSKRIQPLMPEDVSDEVVAISSFEKEFENRYGACHPSFQGTLADALQAACYQPAKERRPLAIYLHHDASVLTNVFCTQLLCSETVVSYLTLNFVTWAWDLTFESNKTFLLAILSQHLGMGAAHTVKNLGLNSLPAFIIVTKVRSTPEILTVIPGNVGLDDLMTRLINAVEVFNSEIQSEIWEESEREAREMVKREQDLAYEASLLADRAKEEARRQEFEEKMKQEEEKLMKEEQLEQIRQHEEAIKDAVRKSLAEQLPPEPPSDSTQPVSHIRVRVPNGGTIGRSFTADTPLSLLLMYIASEGYPSEQYKVLASWPRIDLTTTDETKTLEELKLYPKETLTLEER
ncbi:FAS-associated factor 1 like protein [Argiope bruennichi]|uniref:FAS-associated factor 1 like protein n=2 Tax=Argiope bruennichi TaxID=94029 RepID=A0A8T0EQU5_ARGBR|nr:FAS-associated factor 1 like protein [Argiope bruennichi]